MTKLPIAEGLSLPLDAVTQKFAWLGRTGSGKTYGCKRFVEQVLHAGAQVIVIDTMGMWPGLRLGPNAFKIHVFGGLYGDIDIKPSAGALIADVAVDHGASLILDVSLMTDVDRTKFVTAFGARFFHRKRRKKSAVHVVLDEGQDIVPQDPQDGESMMLHEWHRIAKQGRGLGIGMSIVSQRPQEVNKKALNQVECVFAFQLTGPHERKALEYWLSSKGAEDKLSDILPRLEVGAPHVWSPSWLKMSQVVKMLPIETVDTSRTPKVGERTFREKQLSPLDLGALKEAVASSAEQAKANDPKTLRAELAKVKAELAKAQKATPATAAPSKERRVEVPVLTAKERASLDRLSKALERAASTTETMLGSVGVARTTLSTLEIRIGKLTAAPAVAPRVVAPRPETKQPVREPIAPRRETNGAGGRLPEGNRAVLTAIAQYPSGADRDQLSVLTGYKRSTRDAYLQRLRDAGYIAGDGVRLFATEAGLAALGSDFRPLPTGEELQQHWFSRLPTGESQILKVLVNAFPDAVPRSHLEEAIRFKRSTRDAYIQRLVARRVITIEDRGEVRASSELFDG